MAVVFKLLDAAKRDSHGALEVAEMLVDKQPSVANTIQKEYSYFSGINISILTHENQSDCSQCVNIHPLLMPGQLQYLELIIDPVVALVAGW